MKNRYRQRQRQSPKLIILLGLSLVLLVIVFIVVINVSHVDQMKAAVTGVTSSNIVLVPDEVYATSLTVKEQPAARTAADVTSPQAGSQLGHVAKSLSPGN